MLSPHGDPTENRTPVSSLRGSRPRPLDDGAVKEGDFVFCPQSATPAGFQPTTPSINCYRQLLHLPRLPITFIVEILRSGTVVSTHVALLLQGRRNMDYSNLSILLSKAFLSKSSWLLKVRDKGTRTQLFTMPHIKQDSTLPARYLCFQPTQPAAGNVPVPPRWTRPMSCDLIVKLLFPVAEPAQMGMQVILAIITLTGLLYNCFRTRLDYVRTPSYLPTARLDSSPLPAGLLLVRLTATSLVTPGRLELPFTA